MSTPRALYTMTLLPDGRAVVVGGVPTVAAENLVNARAEAFDPASGAWAGAGAVANPRFEHCAAALPDGRLLIAGGQNWYTDLASAELFDPATGTWAATTPMVTRHYWCAATLLDDGRVLVTGGLQYPGYQATTAAEIYDPAHDVWSPAPPMSVARGKHTATLLADGRVLVVGGVTQSDHVGALAGAEIYDPAHDAWSPAGALTEPRGEHTATRLSDGTVLIAGGIRTDCTDLFLASAERYAPATGAWTAAATMHDGRTGHVALRLDNGRALVAGGRNPTLLDSVELYDPAADAWITDAPMNDARDYFAAALLPDGRALVAGGRSSSVVATVTRATAEIYVRTSGPGCAAPADCPTGFCVDQICCDTACDGTCAVCVRASGAAFDGFCTTLPDDADGVCTRTCVSVNDCPPPSVCSPEGRCAAPPPMASDVSGCRAASRAPGGASLPGVTALTLAVAATLARRRGRRRGSGRALG